jgi:hypothetical protein
MVMALSESRAMGWSRDDRSLRESHFGVAAIPLLSSLAFEGIAGSDLFSCRATAELPLVLTGAPQGWATFSARGFTPEALTEHSCCSVPVLTVACSASSNRVSSGPTGAAPGFVCFCSLWPPEEVDAAFRFRCSFCIK